MSRLRDLKSTILAEGTDLRIEDADVDLIRKNLPAEGALSRDEVEFLTELRTEARAVCPAFDLTLLPAFKAHLLADGKISHTPSSYPAALLYGGGGIDPAERQFLIELRKEVREVSPDSTPSTSRPSPR